MKELKTVEICRKIRVGFQPSGEKVYYVYIIDEDGKKVSRPVNAEDIGMYLRKLCQQKGATFCQNRKEVV